MAVEWRGRLTSRAENAHAQLGRVVVEQGAAHRERRAQQRVARAAALQNIERLKRQQQDGEAEAAAAVGREAASLQARLMQRLAGAQAALEARHALTAVFGAPKQAEIERMRARDSFTAGAADLWSRVGAAQQLGATVTAAAAAAAASAAATARVTEVVSEVAGASRDALATASDLSARTAGVMGEELSIMRNAAARRHLAQLQAEARLHEGLERQLIAPAMRDNLRHAALMQGLAHEEKTVEQAVLSQPQEWVAILTHSLREGEATGAEAAVAARGVAAAHAQELEAAAASGNEEMGAELALHRSRCQQQASEAEALQQRLVQDRNVTARQATWDDPHAWRTRPGEQREQEAALAACKRDWEAQLAEQAREVWRKGGEVIAGWVQPSARGDLARRDISPPELQKKLQAHLHLLAETQLRANEAARQAERLVSEERAAEEATAAHREASEAGNVALGKLALQLQTDGATLLRQQQAAFELELEQHSTRAAMLVAKPAPIEEIAPPAPPAPSDQVQVARSTYRQSAKDEERVHELIAEVHDQLAAHEAAALQMRGAARTRLEGGVASRNEALRGAAERGATEVTLRGSEALQREGNAARQARDALAGLHEGEKPLRQLRARLAGEMRRDARGRLEAIEETLQERQCAWSRWVLTAEAAGHATREQLEVRLTGRQEADAQAQEARRATSLRQVREVGSGEGDEGGGGEGGGGSESLSAALDEIVILGGKRLAKKIAASNPQAAAQVVGGSSNGSLSLHSLVGTPLEPLAAARAKLAAPFTLPLPWTTSADVDAAATPLEEMADTCAREFEATLPRQEWEIAILAEQNADADAREGGVPRSASSARETGPTPKRAAKGSSSPARASSSRRPAPARGASSPARDATLAADSPAPPPAPLHLSMVAPLPPAAAPPPLTFLIEPSALSDVMSEVGRPSSWSGAISSIAEETAANCLSSLQPAPALEEGLALALAAAVEATAAQALEASAAPEAAGAGAPSSEMRQGMSRTAAMHVAQREALEKEAGARRDKERRGEYEAQEEAWLSRLEAEQERLAAELRQARGETAEARRSLADAVVGQQPPPQLDGAGAGELEAQWVRRLVQVQAAEASSLHRRLQYIELDNSLVGSSAAAADLLAKREALFELGRVIDKAKVGERMALGPLGVKA